jgi:ATP-dependent protease ClpP protease subunit
MSEKGYIYNQSKDSTKANILIDGEISDWWGVGLQSFSRDIANSNADEIMVQINSGGGSVTEGQAIAAYIKGSPYNINTSILGLCASIATFIAMAGKSTSIAKGSLFMIHNASGGAYGESEDLRKTADLLDLVDENLTNIYVDTIEKNGKLINGSREETKKQVIEWQNNETFFTAEQAVQYGFIQKVVEGVEFVNKIQAQKILNSCSKYKNVPTDFINNIQNIVNMADEKPTVTDEVKESKVGFMQAIKNYFGSDEGKKQIVEANAEAKANEAKDIEAAKALLASQGLEVVAKAVEVEEVEKVEEEPNNELEKLKNELAAAKLKAQRLEEEAQGAPSTKPRELNAKTESIYTDAELEGFASITNAIKNR